MTDDERHPHLSDGYQYVGTPHEGEPRHGVEDDEAEEKPARKPRAKKADA